MTYIQIDVEDPKTVQDLAIQLIQSLLTQGGTLSELHLTLAEAEQAIRMSTATMDRMKSAAWDSMRSDAETHGAPKDPLTGRSNTTYTESLVTKSLRDNKEWAALQDALDDLQGEVSMLRQQIAGETLRLKSVRTAADLLGGLL